LNGAPPLLAVASFSFGAALLLTPLARLVARATGYLDHPDERKPHPVPTPLLGGVAVAGAMAAGPLLARALTGSVAEVPPPGVLVGGALSLILGLVDDRAPMRPLGKLLGQIAAALFLVAWGTSHGFVTTHPALAALAVLGVVTLLNAVNFLDAMDGIVSALVPVTGLAFVALSLLYGADIDLALAWGAVGAAAGFLVYNAPPARIFLGDAGSHLLGFVLAALALRALDDAVSWPHVAGVLALLAYPLFDVVFVVATRVSERRPIHVGGVDHSTHRLGRICGRWGTLGIISGTTLLGGIVGVWAWGQKSDLQATLAVACLGLGYAIFGVWLGRASPTPGFDT
jgi:UDP-GlcNAc:undecaprenyl-phosphate GlcNAc-1-phosphate transferase